MDTDESIGDVFTRLDTMTLDSDLTEGTLQELGHRYDMALRIIALAQQVRNHLEVALVDAMPEDTMIMGDITVKREKANRWSWKDGSSGERMREDIEQMVATKLATDVMTGEVDPMRRNMVKHAIHELWALLPAPSSMKVEGARRFDLDIFDYRSLSQPNVIKVTPREEPTP